MKPRIDILFDYPEEGWPSMDLAARMLLEQFHAHHAERFYARRVCPPYRRHFRLIPMASRSRFLCNADRLLNRHRDYPNYARTLSAEAEVFHVCDHSYAQLVHALPAERTGVFCHDLDTFRCLLDPAAEPRPRWFKRMARRTLTGLQKAAIVFHTTDAVRQQIERHGLLDPARLVKAPLGVAPEFTPEAPHEDASAQSLLDRLDGNLFLLHVGSCIPRKRIDVLLETFAAVRESHPDLCLVQVGGEWTRAQQQQIEHLGIASALTQVRGLQRATLAEIYRNAEAVLITSEAEGFGLPLIEALACGAPVAASDLPVLREVGGDAVTYVPVAAVPRWVETVHRLMDAPETFLAQDRRTAQARKYSWERHADVIAEAYERLLGISTPSEISYPLVLASPPSVGQGMIL